MTYTIKERAGWIVEGVYVAVINRLGDELITKEIVERVHAASEDMKPHFEAELTKAYAAGLEDAMSLVAALHGGKPTREMEHEDPLAKRGYDKGVARSYNTIRTEIDRINKEKP